MVNDTMLVISSGCYSDYSVDCIFDGTREEAEETAKKMNTLESAYSDFRVEELPLYHFGDSVGTITYILNTTIHQDELLSGEISGEADEYSYYVPFFYEEHDTRITIKEGREHLSKTIKVSGTDKENVKKVFYDTVAQVKAEMLEL